MSQVPSDNPEFPQFVLRNGDDLRARTYAPSVGWCIFLLFYFSTCDVLLKFLPISFGTPLRYLPEVILYVLAIRSIRPDVPLKSFPLFWPLLASGCVMVISGVLNGGVLGAVTDYRIFFRFTAFSFLLWNVDLRRSDILHFVNGFLGLTILQLIVGGLELAGGDSVKYFFTPALGWGSSNGAPIADKQGHSQATWLAGTLAHYNNYGLMMVLSCILAVSLYLALARKKYIWLAALSAVAIVLSSSRHCLILVGIAVPLLVYFHRGRLTRLLRPLLFAAVLTAVVWVSFSSSSSSASLGDRFTSIFSAEVLASDNPQENIRAFMIFLLPPRFLASYPFFGQGPIPASEAVAVGDTDTNSGPMLKAAPELPGWVTYYIGDVVWLLVLGLYGVFGVIAVASVFASVGWFSRKAWLGSKDPVIIAMAQTCAIFTVLIMVAAFFSQEVVARDTIPVFWCIAGIVFSLNRQSSESTAPTQAMA